MWYNYICNVVRIMKYMCIVIDVRNVKLHVIVETELGREPPLNMKLRLSWVESLRCGHSCEKFKHVRSETELGRESQKWPLIIKM